METKANSYNQIFKATSVFGGVQVINILILLLRSKIIAVLLGPAGMGISTLLTSTTGFLSALTNFGLGVSAVKNVALASNNQEKLARTVAVFRRLVWITGCLGFVLTLSLAPVLSEMAFNNKTHTIAFLFLSITLLFTQLSAGQNVILRGLRKIQYMAKASVLGAFIGLIISVPLYYLFKEDGIVPAIILTSLSTLLISYFYSNQVKIPKIQITKKLVISEGREMLKMGFLISLSGLISLGTSYLMRIYISNTGSIADVGLYTAGFAIIGTYVSLVFTAMSTDYYPRLAAISSDNNKCKQEINQQAEIALLILSPILILFLVFIKFAIVLLYSNQFVAITSMVQWASLGIYFKAVSWSIGIIFMSKGDSKVFFWNEVIANVYMFSFNLIGYYFWGLTGLGVSFLLGYAIHLLQVYVVSRKKYEFQFDNNLLKILCCQFLMAVLCFTANFYFLPAYAYITGGVVFIVSLIYTIYEFNKRVNIRSIFIKIKRKFIKK